MSEHVMSRVFQGAMLDESCCNACGSVGTVDEGPRTLRVPLHFTRREKLVIRARHRGIVEEFPVTKEVVVVGRTATKADIVLDDRTISRVQCRFVFAHGRVLIEDLGSTCGTVVDGRPIGRTALHWGDVVKVGDSELEIVRV